MFFEKNHRKKDAQEKLVPYKLILQDFLKIVQQVWTNSFEKINNIIWQNY